MTLLELKQEVDRLLETQSPHTETTVGELVVRDAGRPSTFRYIDAAPTERGVEMMARNIEETQRKLSLFL